ncbi:NACHT, LRR and PYD domains-containing protein 1b allele 3-like, partial [Sinocyclocheilus rhinocerous]|uniref:NACHT, LRR and PYD domains-containing protein 1b allele 3-like n=1 Tax=Sinocyclocheilus rhinocerous TaxID=307959 RepID=UPI0007B78D46
QSDRSISPESSCVSMKSNQSMEKPVKFEGRHTSPDLSEQLTDTPGTFRGKHMPSNLSHDTKLVQSRFKSDLLSKFQCLHEGTVTQGNPTLLNKIYTELYITESESGEINNEHEVRQIETQSRRAATEDTAIKCNDIFRALPGQDKAIRTVLTKGVAGIGKTVSVQKFILDWAEGKENQDVQLIFPLPFREINLMKDKTLSLSDLLHVFFPETKEMEISSEEYKVLFIFDGLDECRLSLDFKSDVRLCDVSESASVDVLLMNLIVGNLLPSALIWITSRPAAADLVPSECVHRVTEVRGFNEPQKEEYFRKRISDQSLADRIISHLKSSRSLFIMCHIPVFCWISAAVLLSEIWTNRRNQTLLFTVSQMKPHFHIHQSSIKHEKDYEKTVKDEDMIVKLGKLAFEQLVKGNLIFYEEDLRECGIDVTEAAVYSGLCTQIFREELGLYQGQFIRRDQKQSPAFECLYEGTTTQENPTLLNEIYTELYITESESGEISNEHEVRQIETQSRRAATEDTAIKCSDIFRPLPGQEKAIRTVLTKGVAGIGKTVSVQKFIVDWAEGKENQDVQLIFPLPFREINLMKDKTLSLSDLLHLFFPETKEMEISSDEYKGLFIFDGLDECRLSLNFKSEVKLCNISESASVDELLMNLIVGNLLPSALIWITSRPAAADLVPSEALESNQTLLRELMTQTGSCSYNKEETFEFIKQKIRENHSPERSINLFHCLNELGDDLLMQEIQDYLRSGQIGETKLSSSQWSAMVYVLLTSEQKMDEFNLKQFIGAQNTAHEVLQKLLPVIKESRSVQLCKCGVTDEGCAALASALRSNPSHLRELDLSFNKLGASGVKLLSDGLKDPRCKLETL